MNTVGNHIDRLIKACNSIKKAFMVASFATAIAMGSASTNGDSNLTLFMLLVSTLSMSQYLKFSDEEDFYKLLKQDLKYKLDEEMPIKDLMVKIEELRNKKNGSK